MEQGETKTEMRPGLTEELEQVLDEVEVLTEMLLPVEEESVSPEEMTSALERVLLDSPTTMI